MKIPKPPLAVDLFCGAGGLSEGLRLAGFQSVVASDFDESAGASYADNHTAHGTRFIPGDITNPKVRKEILSAIDGRTIDLVAGGPPCQAFSQMRNHDRETKDPRNALYRQLMAMVAELSPKVFLMENVVGMQNIAGGTVGAKILRDLSLGGRYVLALKILDASDYGVPQTRRRVLIVGVRADLKAEPRFPQPVGVADKLQLVRRVDRKGKSFYERPSEQLSILGGTSLAQRLLDPECLDFVTVEQAIGDLTQLKPSERLERKPSNAPTEYPSVARSAYQRLMRGNESVIYNADVPSIREDTVRRLTAIPQGGNFRDIPVELQGRYLNGTKWGPDLGREELSRKHYYAYRKLHPDYVSWTLNTKTDCVYHYAVPRALSVREFARLHSFPDAYRFMHGDRHSRYQQVGNAVPPLLGKAIGVAIMPLLRPTATTSTTAAATRSLVAARKSASAKLRLDVGEQV
jgi:DNA (cytosine-5)-methyltransferase 1